MSLSQEILASLRYQRWATLRVWEEISKLTPEQLHKDLKGSFPSVWDTAVHLWRADTIWLARLKGETPQIPEIPGCLYEFRDAWTAVHDGVLEWAGRLTEEDLNQTLHYKTMAGQPAAHTIAHCLLHLVNHGTHHRGQITWMLRQLGEKPVPLDLLLFYQESE